MKDILRRLKAQEKQILREAKTRAKQIRKAITALSGIVGGAINGAVEGAKPKRRRRKMSPAARAKISAAMKARWAKRGAKPAGKL
jgi:hypothetical protein